MKDQEYQVTFVVQIRKLPGGWFIICSVPVQCAGGAEGRRREVGRGGEVLEWRGNLPDSCRRGRGQIFQGRGMEAADIFKSLFRTS